jgi:ribonucleotide reductase alpha subunit
LNSSIRNGEIKHTGLIPFIKKWEKDLRSVSQGGLRTGSATVYFPIWHYDFESLVVLKNNQGTEETRARQLDYGVQMAAMFWERLVQKKNITLFSPSEVPGLYDLFHQDIAKFEQEYAKFEADPAIRKKVVSADEAIRTLFATERSGTGRIYAYNVDNVQFQGSYDPTTDTVTQSNLCCVVGDTEVQVKHRNNKIENMDIQSFVARWQLGQLNGSLVRSFHNGQVVWSSVSAAMQTKTVTELFEIEDEQGNVIRCTGDHRIFTKNRGYVRADELVENDVLCSEILF